MTFEHWLLFLASAAGLSLTPGPSGLLCITHSARFGSGRALLTIAGGALGFFMLIAASLAGAGALLAASHQAFAVLKLAGAAYLIYLGIRVWRSAPTVLAEEHEGAGNGPDRLQMFLEGFWVAVLNPKALIFFAAFLPHFVVADTCYWVELMFFGGTFVVVEIIYELILVGFARRFMPWLALHGRRFNRATGAAFIGLGAALAGSDR